jgi:plasmid replication initiation protein
VVAITFNIFDNPNNQREKVGEKIKPKEVKALDTSTEELERIYATVSNYVTKAKVKKWLKDLPIEQIEKGIAYTINYIKAGNTVNNIGGMLNTMVSTPTFMISMR